MTLTIDGSPVAVVPKEPLPELVAAFWRTKNGHHFAGDPPPADTSDYAAYRALVAAAPPELLEAILEMRAALEGLLSWYGVDTDGRHRRRAEAVLSRITVTGETSDAV